MEDSEKRSKRIGEAPQADQISAGAVRIGDADTAEEGLEARVTLKYGLDPGAWERMTEEERLEVERTGPAPARDSLTSGINDF